MIRPREALLSGRAGRTLLALAVGTAALPFGQLLLPPLLPAIVREFSVSPALAGVGLTLMWASAALAMFPGGRLSDVTGRMTALVVAVALATVGFLALALAPEFGPFVLAIVVCGVAVGIYEPSAFALVSKLFVSRRGQALGVINSSYNAGSALAGAAAAVGFVGFWSVMTASLLESLSRERLGGDYGFSRAVFFGVGSLGPAYTGVVAQRLSYATAYGGLVGCFLLSAVAIHALGRFE